MSPGVSDRMYPLATTGLTFFLIELRIIGFVVWCIFINIIWLLELLCFLVFVLNYWFAGIVAILPILLELLVNRNFTNIICIIAISNNFINIIGHLRHGTNINQYYC